MVQKELGQEAKTLAILFVAFPADFENGNRLLPVDLVAGRMVPDTLGRMSSQLSGRLEVLEAELANEQLRQARVLFRIGTLIPDLHFVTTELDVARLFGVWQAFECILLIFCRSSL